MLKEGEWAMIKKILGNAPFDISCNDVVLVPGKTKKLTFRITNDTEYDLPLEFCLGFSSAVKSELSSFNVIVPADGNTVKGLKLDLDEQSKIFTSEHLCEVKIRDGVLESESDYEMLILCEMAYKCTEVMNDFSPTEEKYFTSNGSFFINKDECICLEIPLAEEKTVSLEKDEKDVSVWLDKTQTAPIAIKLHAGLNRLCIKANDDMSFSFYDKNSMQKIYLNTLNTEFFLEG